MSEASETIEHLLERLRSGDREAMGVLFARYRPKLRRMVEFRIDRRLLGRFDASDVLQDAYLDAAQRLKHYLSGPEMPILVWLRLIVGQRLVDLHRRHLGAQRRDARLEASSSLPGDGTSLSIAACIAGRMTAPSKVAMRAELESRLAAALDQMDPIDREVLALRHFEELSNDEVAEVLGLQKSAASNRYVRALKRLKAILAETTLS